MEVMESQVEPMLTLTTDDDINWMVVTASPLPVASLPSQTDIKDTESGNATGISTKWFSHDFTKKANNIKSRIGTSWKCNCTNVILVRTKLVRKRVRKPQPPKPAGPIIIDNPVNYQLALQQQQQVILGRGRSDLSLDGSSMNFGSEDDAKHLAEFLKPTGVQNGDDIRYDGVKDDKVNSSQG